MQNGCRDLCVFSVRWEGLVHGRIFHGGKLSLDSPVLAEFWTWIWVEPPAFSWQEGVGLLGSSPQLFFALSWSSWAVCGGQRVPLWGHRGLGTPPDLPSRHAKEPQSCVTSYELPGHLTCSFPHPAADLRGQHLRGDLRTACLTGSSGD